MEWQQLKTDHADGRQAGRRPDSTSGSLALRPGMLCPHLEASGCRTRLRRGNDHRNAKTDAGDGRKTGPGQSNHPDGDNDTSKKWNRGGHSSYLNENNGTATKEFNDAGPYD